MASSTDIMGTSTDALASTSLEAVLGVAGTSTTKTGILGGIMDMIKNLILKVDALTKTLADFMASVKNLTVDTLSAKKIYIDDGYEMKDSVTGDIYCIRLANGDFLKTKATCDGTTVVTA